MGVARGPVGLLFARLECVPLQSLEVIAGRAAVDPLRTVTLHQNRARPWHPETPPSWNDLCGQSPLLARTASGAPISVSATTSSARPLLQVWIDEAVPRSFHPAGSPFFECGSFRDTSLRKFECTHGATRRQLDLRQTGCVWRQGEGVVIVRACTRACAIGCRVAAV